MMLRRTRSEDLPEKTDNHNLRCSLKATFSGADACDDHALLNSLRQIGNMTRIELESRRCRRVFFSSADEVERALAETGGTIRTPRGTVTLSRSEGGEGRRRRRRTLWTDMARRSASICGERELSPWREAWKAGERQPPLAPPFHLLPDTPFFKRCPVAPPPEADDNDPNDVIQAYIQSMKMHDNKENLMQMTSLELPSWNHARERERRSHATAGLRAGWTPWHHCSLLN